MSANNKYQMENDEEEDQIFEPHSEVTDLLLTSEFESNAELVPKVLIPQRVILTILLCIGVIIMYLQRVTLSIAIIPISDDNNWDHTTQGIVLCSFFAGYMATQIPGGWLAKRYGGKHVMLIGVLGSSIATAILPFVSKSLYAFVAARVIAGTINLIVSDFAKGLFGAVTYPAMHDMVSHWLPDNERSTAISFIWSGSYVGTIVPMVTGPHVVGAWSWQYLFYLFGGIGILWCLLWLVLSSSNPESSKFISKPELNYLLAHVKEQNQSSDQSVPWKTLLSLLPVWAIIINHFCVDWGFYIFLAWMPTYFNDHLGFNLDSTGYFSVIPYVTMFIATMSGGKIADYMIDKKVDKTFVRKLMQLLGLVPPAACLFLLCYAAPDKWIALVETTFAVGFGGFAVAGFAVNGFDIAPAYAGVLMGYFFHIRQLTIACSLSNTVATIPGVVGVALAGFLLDVTDSWSSVFFVAAGVYLFGAVVWLLFSTGQKIPLLNQSLSIN